jgi:hypothetical protein
VFTQHFIQFSILSEVNHGPDWNIFLFIKSAPVALPPVIIYVPLTTKLEAALREFRRLAEGLTGEG